MKKSQMFSCPLTEIEFSGACPNTKCMHYSRKIKAVSCCRHTEISNLNSEQALSREERKSRASTMFDMSVEETNVAVRRVIAVLCVNEYFRYIFDKEVTEAKAKEMDLLKTQPERYEAWKSNARKIRFTDLITTIDFLKQNL